MGKRGNPGYGKMEGIRANVDKFSPLFWELMEKMANSKAKEDQKFFITEFNKIQTRMIPQTLQGDDDGGPIQVKVINYGSNPSAQLSAEELSATSPRSAGFRI
jgi:hypothetical protein